MVLLKAKFNPAARIGGASVKTAERPTTLSMQNTGGKKSRTKKKIAAVVDDKIRG